MEKLGIKPKAPIKRGPPFPAALGYLWGWFCEISSGLPINGMCVPRVAWADIEAWSRVMRIEVAPWEAAALVAIGNVRCEVESRAMTEKK